MAAFASSVAGTPWARRRILGCTSGPSLRLSSDPKKVLDYLGQGNIAIFMSMYPQILAYKAGGLANIQTMFAQKLINAEQMQGWTSSTRASRPTM